MEVIKSFTVDHLSLLPGLYISRVDTINGFTFTSYDLRITRPNFEPVMNTAEIHTLEHLGATYWRLLSEIKTDIMYFGPMGCRTGFYLIVAGERSVAEMQGHLIKCLDYIIDFDGDIPGASAKECGNYLDMNLAMAKSYAKKYRSIL